MRDKKVIKKEQQQLLRKLSDLYREHVSITDHEVEKSKNCLICENIRAWRIFLDRLDNELKSIRIFKVKQAKITRKRRL